MKHQIEEKTDVIFCIVYWQTSTGETRVPAGATVVALPRPHALDSILHAACKAGENERMALALRFGSAPIRARTAETEAQIAALEGRQRQVLSLRDSAVAIRGDGDRAGRSLDSLFATFRRMTDSVLLARASVHALIDLRGHFVLKVKKQQSLELVSIGSMGNSGLGVWRAAVDGVTRDTTIDLREPVIAPKIYCGLGS